MYTEATPPSWTEYTPPQSLKLRLAISALSHAFEPWFIKLLQDAFNEKADLAEDCFRYVEYQHPPPPVLGPWTPSNGFTEEHVSSSAHYYYAVMNQALTRAWTPDELRNVIRPLVFEPDQVEAILALIPQAKITTQAGVVVDTAMAARYGLTGFVQKLMALNGIINTNTPSMMLYLGRALHSHSEQVLTSAGTLESWAPSIASQMAAKDSATAIQAMKDLETANARTAWQYTRAGFGGPDLDEDPPTPQAVRNLLLTFGSTPEEGLRSLAQIAFGSEASISEDAYPGMGGPAGRGARRAARHKRWKAAGEKLRNFARKAVKWLEPIGDAVLGLFPGAASAKAAIKGAFTAGKAIAGAARRARGRGGPLIDGRPPVAALDYSRSDIAELSPAYPQGRRR